MEARTDQLTDQLMELPIPLNAEMDAGVSIEELNSNDPSGDPPWTEAIEEMGRAVRDHIEEVLIDSVQEVVDKKLAELHKEIESKIEPLVKKALEGVIAEMKEDLESSISAMKESIGKRTESGEGQPVINVIVPEQPPPVIHVDVPPPRRMEKRFVYDEQSRPSIVYETPIDEEI